MNTFTSIKKISVNLRSWSSAKSSSWKENQYFSDAELITNSDRIGHTPCGAIDLSRHTLSSVNHDPCLARLSIQDLKKVQRNWWGRKRFQLSLPWNSAWETKKIPDLKVKITCSRDIYELVSLSSMMWAVRHFFTCFCSRSTKCWHLVSQGGLLELL
jgi:hypothetical protein